MYVLYMDQTGEVKGIKASTILPFPFHIGTTIADAQLQQTQTYRVWCQQSWGITHVSENRFGFPYDVFSISMFSDRHQFEGVISLIFPSDAVFEIHLLRREADILRWLFAISENVLMLSDPDELWSQFRDLFLQLFYFKGGVLFRQKHEEVDLVEQFGSLDFSTDIIQILKEDLIQSPTLLRKPHPFSYHTMIVERYDFHFCGVIEILYLFRKPIDAVPTVFNALLDFYRLTGTVVCQRAQLQQLTIQDPLTRIWNRRALENHMEEYFALHSPAPAIFILFDLDHFKQLNDQFGHQAGDVALQKIASYIRNTLHKGDWIARLGGDEFVLVLHETKWQEYESSAQLISWLRNSPLIEFKLGITAGEVEIPREATTYQEAYRLADQRLYEGKKSGRNCVVMDTTTIRLPSFLELS